MNVELGLHGGNVSHKPYYEPRFIEYTNAEVGLGDVVAENLSPPPVGTAPVEVRPANGEKNPILYNHFYLPGNAVEDYEEINMVNPEEGCMEVPYGPKTHSNYGGYGFWCNKACAERKDAEAAAQQAYLQAQAQALAQLGQADTPKSNVALYIGLGLGFIVLATGGILLAQRLKKS